MRALIYAAGYGKRLNPQTLKMAKPALPFLNIPLMAYPLFYLEQLGLKELVVNTHYLPETIVETGHALVGNRYLLNFSHEKDQIMGSGGGLAQALEKFSPSSQNDPLFIANGDSLVLSPEPQLIFKMFEFHQRHKPLATLLVGNFPVAKESFGGVYVNSHQEVQCFSTQPVDNPNLIARHFTGFMIVQPEIIQCVNKINSNIFYDVFQKQINLGKKILAYENTDPTISFEVGNEADYLSTTAKFLSILSLDGPLAQTLRKILQKYSPSWEEGWIQNSQGTKILSQTSLPDHVKVEDFIVAGKEILFSNPITLSRCVVNHHYTFKTTEQSVHDRFLV